MSNTQATETADHRIFGFTPEGQLRVSLFDGQDSHAPGAFYSWVVCATPTQLAHKLANQWEQPLTEGEWDVIEDIETLAETEAETIDCEDCGGNGRDPGSLNPFEPEDCPSCGGSGRETPTRPRRPAGRQGPNVPARQEVA